MSQDKVSEFMENINEQKYTGLVIIQMALMMGVCLFLGVVVFLYFNGKANAPKVDDSALQFANILTAIVVFVTFSTYAIAMILPNMLLNKSLENIYSNDNPPHAFLSTFTGSRILQLAVLEGASLLSIVVCLLNTFNGVLYQKPIYWYVLAPVAIMFIFVSLTFPTKSRLAQIYQDKYQAYQMEA